MTSDARLETHDASAAATSLWEPVIGLEVHCELKTRTKLFCGCANSFGDEPNTNICPVCLGLPGSLPVINARAVEIAMAIGLALHCDVQRSIFHRKNYFYPDMPKDYQISQYDEPVNVNGWLQLPGSTRVGIVRAHVEEDTGKTSHVGGSGRIHEADHLLVDYNRAGVPLVEIVSAPDIRTANDARQYVEELRGILVAIGASDGRMEEGSLRVDANVSVRRTGSVEFGTRCEIKNMNSLRSLVRAIEFETRRQVTVLEQGGEVLQETRHWDESAQRTVTLRSKEEAFDYRYFPEPDLVPLAPLDPQLSELRTSQPPLPAERRDRLFGLLGSDEPTTSQRDQVSTVVGLDLDELVSEAVAAGVDPSLALARTANELAAHEAAASIDRDHYLELLRMEQSRELTATQSKTVLGEMIETHEAPGVVAKRRGFEALGEGTLEKVLDEVLAENPDEWSRYRDGDDKLAGFFTGKVMRKTSGQANGKEVAQLLGRRRSAKS